MEKIEKVTLSEARKRWSSYTRHILSDAAKKRIKNAKWVETADETAYVGDGIKFVFEKQNGRLYARVDCRESWRQAKSI